MRIRIAAVGRSRRSPEADLCATYIQRIHAWPVEIKEVEAKGSRGEGQVAEASLLRSAIPAGAFVVCLDPGGKPLGSVQFARLLDRWAGESVRQLAFVIGGADGLSPDLVASAGLSMSLGEMTWPHLLARAMLVEQIYRAQQILAGHPYHRA
jgi:23S rRNA (pseudouridine1915-N3)-methyltransferase